MATKNDYITVAPVTPKGKWAICARRIGTKDRFAFIAEARTQIAADNIVEALQVLQGEIKKLDTPLQSTVEDLRCAVAEKAKLAETLRLDIRSRDMKIRTLEGELDTKRNEIGSANVKLRTAEQERDRLRAEFAAYRDAAMVGRPPELTTTKG